MKRYSLYLCGLLALWAFYGPPPVHATCEVHTTVPTYADLTFVGADLCDVNGNKFVTLSGTSGGGLGTNEAAAPSRSEGSSGSFSFDLAGNARVTMGTLLAGEDQTNNLLMIGPGAVRVTSFGSVTSTTSSAVTIVPNGPVRFVAQIINATSETKAATVTIYGNVVSSTTGGIPICTITLPSTATTLQLQDICPLTQPDFLYYFYTASVYTSASSAPLTVYAMY